MKIQGDAFTRVQNPPLKCRKYLFHAALTCRSKVRFAPFFLQEKHPPASLHFLFHKKLRSARLFGCKRPYDGSLSLPAFACYEGLTPTAEMPKKIFSCDSHKNPRTSVPGFFLFRFAPFFSINTRIFGRE